MAKSQSKATNETKTFSLISNEKLLSIYAAMLKCRLLEQRATTLFQHGRLNNDLHVSSGREAIAASAVIDLSNEDILCLAQGDWLPAFVKGLSPENMFRMLAPTGSHLGNAIEIEADHKNIFFPSSKADLAHAVIGLASTAATTNNGAVTVTFIHSDSDSFAKWRKAINIAGTKKLPIIFVHYSDLTGESSSPRSQKPEALVHGIPSIAVDGRDPVAIYRVAYEAIVRGRQLRGATLLECFIDSQQSSPAVGENHIPSSAPSDPVAAMEGYLKSKNIAPDAHNRELIAGFNRDLDLATRFLDK